MQTRGKSALISVWESRSSCYHYPADHHSKVHDKIIDVFDFLTKKILQDTERADSITGALSAIIVNIFKVQQKIKAIYLYILRNFIFVIKEGQ